MTPKVGSPLFFILFLGLFTSSSFLDLSYISYLWVGTIFASFFHTHTYRLQTRIFPALIILSPVFGYISFGFFSLLLSDFYLCLFFIYVAGRSYKSGSVSFSMILIFLLLFSQIILNYFLGNLDSLKPIVYLFNIFSVILFFRNNPYVEDFFLSIVHVSCAVVVIMLYFFLKGINISDVSYLSKSGDIKLIADQSLVEFYVQPTYFYSNIHYLLGIGILTVIEFLKKKEAVMYNLMILFFLMFGFLIMMNKTSLISLLLSLLIAYSFTRPFIVLRVVAIFLFGLIFLNYVLEDSYLYLYYLNRLSGVSSLSERLVNFLYALKEFSNYPLSWFFGMGIDFLDSSGESIKTIPFKRSSFSGDLEVGTIDSAWLSYLIELGLFSFLVILIFMLIKIKSQMNLIKKHSIFSFGFQIYIYMFISMLTQMIGYSKVALIIISTLVMLESMMLFKSSNSVIKSSVN